ncbi:MAG: prepilin peptidase [Chloroflexi bacterium]|nr:MAG: prepilin peptidase [Chloroflexota bacterium]
MLALQAYLILVALLLGSFINLAADRRPRGESLVRPRSHCRSCGRVLNVVDLIPVAGYLIRKGRCATCGVAIGALSPAVEALCGLAMIAGIAALGIGRGAAVGFALVAVIGLTAIAAGFARMRAKPGSQAG